MPFKKVKESIRAYHSGELANVKKSETNFEHHQSPLVTNCCDLDLMSVALKKSQTRVI
ncbi:predicted protein [Botrytis cinerea T4]|uniref:Uncharacterized protein n=1 Tax=Botryotinia fuckeliana (strain T4) TaxID=999810 RepID=G2YNA3_BOTF4|nr:predicted protein [Botrytis cinerea T4]